jgi:type I site-specific restriction endonuclease
MVNQNPEQKARDRIDACLIQAGWVVQDSDKINFNAGPGVAVREYQTTVGPADYVLFVGNKPVGVIEAKREEAAQSITVVESQTESYAAASLKWVKNKEPLRFLYESTGLLTRFTDAADPKPRSRGVFNFHRPETLQSWLAQPPTLRARLQAMPALNPLGLPAGDLGLRDCQEVAITNLEASFKAARPRALIQMATGAGKTYTAITAMYRLITHAGAKRILFLVDTKNLGEQAEQEMMAYTPIDDNRVAAKAPWTREVWFYDYRTNVHHTQKKKPLRFEDLQDFISCYNPDNRHERKATWHETDNPDGRWRAYPLADLLARDKTSLDVFWLKDKSLADLDNLPEPDDLATVIIENIEAGLGSFREVLAGLNKA